jgi:hypothetical protein
MLPAVVGTSVAAGFPAFPSVPAVAVLLAVGGIPVGDETVAVPLQLRASLPLLASLLVAFTSVAFSTDATASIQPRIIFSRKF